MKKAVLVVAVIMVITGAVWARGAEEADKPYQIAGIIFQNDQFFQVIQEGMRAAAADYGVELVLGNSDNDPQQEIELVNTYTVRGVDAIVISPLSETASVQALQQAYSDGIAVVLYNSPLAADFPVSYLNSSQTQLGSSTGAAAADFVESLDGDTIRVAVLAFDSLLPEISDARVSGFIDTLRASTNKRVEIVSRQDGWLSEMALQTAGDILTANPDIDLIYAANEGGTVGSVQAVRNAGLAGQVKVFGIDATAQLAGFLLDDDDVLQAVTGQQPFIIGYDAVEAAVRHLNGESVEKTVIVPGVLLERQDPAGIQEWLADR
ncbi:MAG: sugar ABC transporter substrate-binding protein [Spirochaetaceae bacterium]|nr:MAG: sugar ABC transporter substrate-binding protein [Spirochaetaceae bacterium]